MKVGLVTYHSLQLLDSLAKVARNTAAVLQSHHELVPYPPAIAYCSEARRHELLKGWLLACDAVVGPADDRVLRARAEIGKPVPYVCYLLGTLTRGAWPLKTAHRQMRTTDILIGNCAADAAMCGTFFRNARVRVVPLPGDDATFYPLDAEARLALRQRHGRAGDEIVLLYAGRLTLEKNVHTVLKAFSVVKQRHARSHLLVAGTGSTAPFAEFGAFPVSMERMLRRCVSRLGLERAVTFCGKLDPDSLRDAYNIADAVVNLTLHHDENFGLAQVEAMACGTPTVGSDWGGLRDTVVDHVTGLRVPATVTPSGVKLNWWDAANKISTLVSDRPALERMRETCARTARACYSVQRYGEQMDAILDECARVAGEPAEALEPTSFAERFWHACGSSDGGRPLFRRMPSASEFYRDLVTPFAGQAPETGGAGRTPAVTDILCLASAATMTASRELRINDPIYPIALPVPAEDAAMVESILRVMTGRAVLTVGQLGEAVAGDPGEFDRALAWTIGAGVVLAQSADQAVLEPRSVPPVLGAPLFEIQDVGADCDVLSVA